MPVFQVEVQATVWRIYTIEAANEEEAETTSILNQPDDEVDVFTETLGVSKKEPD